MVSNLQTVRIYQTQESEQFNKAAAWFLGGAMIIVLQVNAPPYMAQGIKESLAIYMERFGDTKVLEVRTAERPHEQMVMEGVINGQNADG
jgi:hypothetical protein